MKLSLILAACATLAAAAVTESTASFAATENMSFPKDVFITSPSGSSAVQGHPGGSDLLQDAIGKDATDLFSSSKHSTNARLLLLSMRVAVAKTSSAFKVEW
ncbi:cytochrome b5 [Aspergillus oryzae]|uniref:Cytochrome b5 n=1 Tax=Aspergillus oryzae TaxID=5062 RepID=A0A1S9DKI5_ASPOZ|nr:cytochrome b5 [Aspergillus oryzae]